MCGLLRPRRRDVVTHGEKGMTVPDIDNINHVGMAVRYLGDTTARYERLGFQLTPFSPHSGAWKRCSG